MRLGVFGGTFDPPHLAHLIVAEQCREQARLDRVLFVPAARPPHKANAQLTPFHHRAEMIELAISGHGQFALSTLEKNRAGPSYTVDTLRALHASRPDDELFLILGADQVTEFAMWREPAGIAALATLLVVARPGFVLPEIASAEVRMEQCSIPLLEISSTDLRERLAEGKSTRFFLPRAVECYIATHRLYGVASSQAFGLAAEDFGAAIFEESE